MTVPVYNDNPAYRESASFILEGHNLAARGQSTLPRSDEEQDRMEAAWSRLSEGEMERLWALSADLDMLHSGEALRPLGRAAGASEQLTERLQAALDGEHWEDVLALLRSGPAFVSKAQVAALRGRAWQHLGHDEAARLFYDFASRNGAVLTPQALARETPLQVNGQPEAVRSAPDNSSRETVDPKPRLGENRP